MSVATASAAAVAPASGAVLATGSEVGALGTDGEGAGAQEQAAQAKSATRRILRSVVRRASVVDQRALGAGAGALLGPPDRLTYATGTAAPIKAITAPRPIRPFLPGIMNSPESARNKSRTA